MALTWAEVAPPDPTGRTVNDFCDLGGGVVVAIGSAGLAYRSTDNGATWALVSLSENNTMTGLAYNGSSALVAVSSGGTNRIQRSTDGGQTWSALAAPVVAGWQSVCWDPTHSTFIAVASSGAGNRTMNSPDGTTWTAHAAAAAKVWSWVAANTAVVVAAAFGTSTQQIMTSIDGGATWTLQTHTSWSVGVGVSQGSSGLAWSAAVGVFAIAAQNGTPYGIMTSPDGTAWTFQSIPDTTQKPIAIVAAPALSAFLATTARVAGVNAILTATSASGWTAIDPTIYRDWTASGWSTSAGAFVSWDTSGHSPQEILRGVTAAAPPAVTSIVPISGRNIGGQTFTLRGTGFLTIVGTPHVLFDGLEASAVSVVSDTVVRGVTPAHATGVVSVELVTIGTLADAYTYVIVSIALPPIPVTSTGLSGVDAVGAVPAASGRGASADGRLVGDAPYLPGGGNVGATPSNLMQLDYQRWLMAVRATVQNIPFLQWGPDSIVGGLPLTTSNDTNITLTLGGSPTDALLKAVSIAVGWIGRLGLGRGGTNADLSATGGAAQYLKQASLGGAVTVGTIPASDIASGAALTRTDDTNVTATLTGTPASALLKAANIALGWTGLLGLVRGGTAADLSVTGGAGQVLKQASVGGAVTVGTIPASDIASGAALTKTDDTNVTLTLGGTPASALLKAVSLALGWTGLLGLARGGTNANLSATGGTSQVLKQVSAGAAVTVAQLAASDLSNGTTGSGAVVLATSPTLVTAALGSSTATTQAAADNSTKLATTAYVDSALGATMNASIYRATNQTLTHNTEAALSLSNADFDSASMWSAGSPTRLTVPTGGTGAYLVRGTVKVGTGFRGTISLRIYKNGALVTEETSLGYDLATGSEYHQVSSLVAAVPTDYFEIKALVLLTAGTGTIDAVGGTGNTFVQAARMTPQTGTGGSGKIAQVVNVETGAVASGSTIIPFDDTIPQNTEGTQFMSLAVTPTSATNKLRIDVVLFATVTATPWIIAALFQDTTASALAVGASFNNLSTAGMMISFTHYMTAGTTSATTFKVRIGPSSAATLTFNGQGGGRLFGGVAASSITITEIVP